MDKETKFIDSIRNISNTTMIFVYLVLTLLIIIIFIMMYFYYNSLKGKEVSNLSALYGDLNGKIKSLNQSVIYDRNANSESQTNDFRFRDYYIKTAYNCCSGGNYRNDYVNLDIMKILLKQGVRGLDFEIYSYDNQPIVGTSTIDNNYVKETFNYVTFVDVMETIRNYAFSTSTAPNSSDPIILHLRIKSNNIEMYKNFALLLQKYDDILLGKKYDSEFNGHNFGAVPIHELLGKVVIIVEKINTSYLECPEFYKFINMTSNSVFMKAIRYNDIATMQISADDLIAFNKQNMTICMPDQGSNPSNPNFNALIETGCQLLAMRYSYSVADEADLEANDAFFDDHGYAFVLKPEKLRYIPVTIPAPPPQNPELSYATRTIQSDFYKFEI